MKEIWINLELYFERYDFYNFNGFFWTFPDFYDFIFYLKTFKINKKMQIARGSHAGATWHARPRGRATRTRATPTWRVICIYLLFTIVIKGVFSLPHMGRVITPRNRRVL